MFKFLKKNVKYIFYIGIFILLIPNGFTFASKDYNFSSSSFFSLFMENLIITILSYMIIPIIFRIKKKEGYEKKTALKIALINSIVVWFIYCLIKASQNMKQISGAAFLYFGINYAILIKRKDIKNENTEQEKEDDEKNDILEEQKKKEDNCNRQYKEENKRSYFYIIILLIIILLGLIGYIIWNNNQTNKKNELIRDDLINTLSEKNAELSSEKEDLELKNSQLKEKADFLDENIVFVIDGYGDYYYTYDQMEKVTQGEDEYYYCAYNVESAIAEGYVKWDN